MQSVLRVPVRVREADVAPHHHPRLAKLERIRPKRLHLLPLVSPLHQLEDSMRHLHLQMQGNSPSPLGLCPRDDLEQHQEQLQAPVLAHLHLRDHLRIQWMAVSLDLEYLHHLQEIARFPLLLHLQAAALFRLVLHPRLLVL